VQVKTDGSFTGTGVSPPVSQYQHFASQGVNIFRIPFAWQLMTPQVGGTISSSFFSTYDSTVQSALRSSTSPYVIIDLHNYARWNGNVPFCMKDTTSAHSLLLSGQIIGQGGPTNDQYASLWSQLAAKYKGNSKIIFGIMNEPHDLSVSTWVTSVQAAVNAIRAAGATSQYILIPGSSYSSAQALPSEAGPSLLGVTDPAGGKSKLIFDVHKYLDSDNSGTHTDCVTDNVGVLTTLVQWLTQNGRQALLSETVSVLVLLSGDLSLIILFLHRAVEIPKAASLLSRASSPTSKRTKTVSSATPCGLPARSTLRMSLLSPRTQMAKTSHSGPMPLRRTFPGIEAAR
jgi:endoglucanase